MFSGGLKSGSEVMSDRTWEQVSSVPLSLQTLSICHFVIIDPCHTSTEAATYQSLSPFQQSIFYRACPLRSSHPSCEPFIYLCVGCLDSLPFSPLPPSPTPLPQAPAASGGGLCPSGQPAPCGDSSGGGADEGRQLLPVLPLLRCEWCSHCCALGAQSVRNAPVEGTASSFDARPSVFECSFAGMWSSEVRAYSWTCPRGTHGAPSLPCSRAANRRLKAP